MEMIIAFSIICTLLLGFWIWCVDGWYSKPQKSAVRAIPYPVKRSFPWCQHSVINPPIQKFVPVLSVIYEDIDGENAENMSSSVATIEIDKAEDTETVPEVLMPEPLSQPDPEAAIDNNKIMDCIHQSWKPDLLLAETDDDSEFIIPPDFFTVDPYQTDPEIVPEVLMPLSHAQQPDAEAVIAAIPDQKITADATHQPGIETLIETDERTEPEDADLLEVAGDSIECVTDKNLAETTEIPPHEMETLPQLNNPDDSIAIATNNKIDPSWKPDPLPLTETDEPDGSVDDSDDEFIIPPDFFVNADVSNQTEPETIPEVLLPQEALSHPQQPVDAQVEIGNNKILDAIYQSWRAFRLLAEAADEPDDSDEDSSDDEIRPPHFFANAEILNQTEPDDSDEEVEMATEDGNVPLEADFTQEAPTGQEDFDSIVPDSPSPPESPSPKRFSFQLTQLPYLPDGYYINLRLNERDNNSGKIKKPKSFQPIRNGITSRNWFLSKSTIRKRQR